VQGNVAGTIRRAIGARRGKKLLQGGVQQVDKRPVAFQYDCATPATASRAPFLLADCRAALLALLQSR